MTDLNNLMEFIDSSPTAFHVVDNIKKKLESVGFKELSDNSKWKIEKNGKYYVTKNSSALIAFQLEDEDIEKNGFNMVVSHTDSPAFKIKPSPEMKAGGGYIKLNTAVYGSMIISTWFDRPLGIAGRVFVKSKNPMNPKEVLLNIEKPVLVIPNLAIHFNRSVNDGMKMNTQSDTLPIASFVNEELEKDNYLISLICENSDVKEEDILDFDLFLYPYEKAVLVGKNDEFISSPRLDDQWMIFSALDGFLENYHKTKGKSKQKKKMRVLFCPDNEEIGSRTGQGADSAFLSGVLERIVLSLEKTKEDYFRMLANSFVISADLAHAVHPNYAEFHDPTTRPLLGKGPVLKYSVNQLYATTAFSAAVFANICEIADIPMQRYINRSDLPGGSTVGSMVAALLNTQVVDMGAAILGMHSARELGAVEDNLYMLKLFRTFYNMAI